LAEKLILIGFDGGNPPFVERFSREGRLPYLSRLIRQGVYSESLPVLPCDTPTNWCTLATGAWPGTHGVTSFHVHLPGEPLNRPHPSTRSYWSKAEFLWDAAERAGKKTVAIMWPLSFPPTCKTGIFVDGTGPSDPQWRIARPALYTTKPKPAPCRGRRSWLGGELPVKLVRAQGWVNAPPSHSPPLETVVELTGTAMMIWTERGWEILEEAVTPERVNRLITHHILILDSEGKGYDRVIITREKDGSRPIASLRAHDWSDWIYEALEKRATPDFREMPSGIFQGYFRYKLTELSPDSAAFTLYRTDIFMASGWAFPEGVVEELIANVGPYIEGLEVATFAILHGDWETCLESIDMQVDWLVRAAKYLKRRYDPDLLFVQIHTQDTVNHYLSQLIDESNPGYDPEAASLAWERFARTYEDVDNLVGGLVDGCSDDETLVAVVSDHGAIPIWKAAWVGVPLMKAGLLTYRTDPETGRTSVDWSRTEAYPWRTYIFVNLKGRDPDGIVDPADYETVRERVLRAIYEMRDPETGICPVALAIRREDAEVLGQWGERVGDVLYYLRPGYSDADFDRDSVCELSLEEISRLQEVGPLRGGGGQALHHQFLPTAESGDMSNRAVLIMSGPGVKQGYRRRTPIWQVDVAPTVCYALGLQAPAQCDGKAVCDFFEG